MTNPTRSEMLDSITHKIARTWWGTWPWETGYYLPVVRSDVIDFILNCKKDDKEKEDDLVMIYHYWTDEREPLDSQSYDCITYIYNLISNAK